jgi:hypothetical protein
MTGYGVLADVLTRAQVLYVPRPKIRCDEDGDLELWWDEEHLEPTPFIITAAITASGRCGFTASIGDWHTLGSAEGQVPPSLIEALQHYGTEVMRRRIAEPLVLADTPDDEDEDSCPRCRGSFEATGGQPMAGPRVCQKCWMEIAGTPEVLRWRQVGNDTRRT